MNNRLFIAPCVSTRAILTAALFLLLTQPAYLSAHHSFSADFDINQQGTLGGEITGVNFRNPHVIYTMRTDMPDGSNEEWALLTHNILTLRKINWNKDTIRVGDRIQVSGSLGREGRKILSPKTVVLADGTRLNPAGGEVSIAYQTTEVTADPGKFYGVTTGTYPIDITGAWDNRYKFTLTVDDLTPKPTPFTAEGRKLYEATESWQDPSKRCLRSGLPRIFGAPGTMEIVDAGDYYLMVYGAGSTVRRIWMDNRPVPADIYPMAMGFSRGRWEGDVLVTETTHLEPRWLDGSGLPMSGEDTRIVEHYTFSEDRLTMERRMTIYDRYYTEPLVRIRGAARNNNIELLEEPECDAESHYEDLARQGRL